MSEAKSEKREPQPGDVWGFNGVTVTIDEVAPEYVVGTREDTGATVQYDRALFRCFVLHHEAIRVGDKVTVVGGAGVVWTVTDFADWGAAWCRAGACETLLYRRDVTLSRDEIEAYLRDPVVSVSGFCEQPDAFTAALEKEIAAAVLGEAPISDFAKANAAPHTSAAYAARDTSSSCARCGGPVLLRKCDRPGGCRTAEERIGEPCVGSGVRNGETFWMAASADTGRPHAEHPTRSGAIALWREAALAAERGR